jgi:hypothetical protein
MLVDSAESAESLEDSTAWRHFWDRMPISDGRRVIAVVFPAAPVLFCRLLVQLRLWSSVMK